MAYGRTPTAHRAPGRIEKVRWQALKRGRQTLPARTRQRPHRHPRPCGTLLMSVQNVREAVAPHTTPLPPPPLPPPPPPPPPTPPRRRHHRLCHRRRHRRSATEPALHRRASSARQARAADRGSDDAQWRPRRHSGFDGAVLTARGFRLALQSVLRTTGAAAAGVAFSLRTVNVREQCWSTRRTAI